eukprot:3196955-Rhodomonas_salina.1
MIDLRSHTFGPRAGLAARGWQPGRALGGCPPSPKNWQAEQDCQLEDRDCFRNCQFRNFEIFPTVLHATSKIESWHSCDLRARVSPFS